MESEVTPGRTRQMETCTFLSHSLMTLPTPLVEVETSFSQLECLCIMEFIRNHVCEFAVMSFFFNFIFSNLHS